MTAAVASLPGPRYVTGGSARRIYCFVYLILVLGGIQVAVILQTRHLKCPAVPVTAGQCLAHNYWLAGIAAKAAHDLFFWALLHSMWVPLGLQTVGLGKAVLPTKAYSFFFLPWHHCL